MACVRGENGLPLHFISFWPKMFEKVTISGRARNPVAVMLMQGPDPEVWVLECHSLAAKK
ncbi:hypothetical protein ACTXT7_008487 [Hymenolepis weldensis]